MKTQHSEEELDRLVRDADERAHKGRVERLGLLLSEEDPCPSPVDALANEYYEEARLCWYMGALVAAIVMSQLALEEMLRSHYRVALGVGGKLETDGKVESAGFADLLGEAQKDGWVSSEEASALHRLRRDYRNPYVHTRDVRAARRGRGGQNPDFLRQLVKIRAPELVGGGSQDDAREAIVTLGTLFPRISSRLWGMDTTPSDGDP